MDARVDGQAARARWVRIGRFAVGAAALLTFAAPRWPDQVDDTFITFAYARRWAETGGLTWGTGERVEGYSNFLHVAALAVCARFGGDLAWIAKSISLVAALGLLALASATLPTTLLGTAALLAFAAWSPLDHWSVMGLETVPFALLVAGGWLLVLRGGARSAAGAWLLALAALARPEGTAYVLAALVVRALRGPRRLERADAWAIAAVALVGAYHVARIAYFGSAIPTSAVVKIGASPGLGSGLAWLARDLAAAAGVFALAFAATRVARRDAAHALFPVALEAAVLLSAGGDWMGRSRLVLPGIAASFVAWAALGRPRAPRPAWALAACTLGAAACLVEPLDYRPALALRPLRRALRAPLRSLGAALDTPDLPDVEWIVGRVPAGASVMIGNVGIVAEVPGVRILDTVGLVDRAVAAWRASPSEATRGALVDAYVHSPPDFRRAVADFASDPEELPEALVPPFPIVERGRYRSQPVSWWRRDERRPDADLVLARWTALAERYPSQPWLVWHRALALADAGRMGDALAVARACAARFPDALGVAEAPSSLAFVRGPVPLTYVPRAGFSLRGEGALTSRPLSAVELAQGRLDLAAEAAGAPVRAVIAWDPPCAEPVVLDLAPRASLALGPPGCAEATSRRVVVRLADPARPLGLVAAFDTP
jgi:hypothetical protein